MNNLSWKIEELHSIKPLEFFELIQKNKDYIHPTFPATVAFCDSLLKTKNFFEESKEIKEQGKGDYFIIKEVNTNTLIGYFQIKNITEKLGRCEFAYFIDQDFQGNGIISTLIFDMTVYVFEVLELNKIIICTSKENLGSQRVARKNNFQQEGVLRNEFLNYRGELEDVVHFGLLKSEFQKDEK